MHRQCIFQQNHASPIVQNTANWELVGGEGWRKGEEKGRRVERLNGSEVE